MGGTIWQAAQPGPVKGYAKNVLKTNEEQKNLLTKIGKVIFVVEKILIRFDSISISFVYIKPTNRQIKLQVLKDDFLNKKMASLSSREKEKKFKCGQCDKNMAFTVNTFYLNHSNSYKKSLFKYLFLIILI